MSRDAQTVARVQISESRRLRLRAGIPVRRAAGEHGRDSHREEILS